MSEHIGKAVSLKVYYGWSHLLPAYKTVTGRIISVDERPWGTDATVKLDQPELIGHLDHPPSDIISLSLSTALESVI